MSNEFIEKIEKMKATELIDYYPEVTDENSNDFMDEFWNRFPFDVWDDEVKELQDTLKKQDKRIEELETIVNIESRVLDRIDRLTKAITGRKK